MQVKIANMQIFQPLHSSLPASSRVILSLLCRNRSAAQSALSKLVTPALVATLKDEIDKSGFSLFILDLIHELNLEPELAALPGEAGTIMWLRRLAAADSLAQHIKAETAVSVAAVLNGLPCVFVKGIVMGRTLYEKPSHRLSYDIDLVVKATALPEIMKRLENLGYHANWTGDCHQTDIGPCDSLEDVSLVPQEELDYFFSFSMSCQGKPSVEFKSNPLDTGLKMRELDRFFLTAELLDDGITSPDSIDHLMLQLMHFHKDGLGGWRSLYDLNLLCNEVTARKGWPEFFRRSSVEGIETSCWLGLSVVSGLFTTAVPHDVMKEAARTVKFPRLRPIAAACSPEFVWHKRNILGLLLNSVLLGDTRRKLRIMAGCLFPSRHFLSSYYAKGLPLTALTVVLLLFWHWLVFLLPGGVLRRTVGPSIWGKNSKPTTETLVKPETMDNQT